MTSQNPQPLWREVVGDTEPWRRGGLALILFGAFTFLNHGFLFAVDILSGNIQQLVSLSVFAVIFWVQFYFIWIGVHWVRWLNGACSGLVGFAFLIWGVRDSAPLLIFSGAYLFAVGAYIGLAPAVYFFALRQRERRRWQENLIVAGVMLLLLASCAAAALGLAGYRNQRLIEGREFADRAFRKIFTEHDAEFLIKHSIAASLANDGQLRWRIMMTDAYMSCGEVRDISPANGALRNWYRWPATIVSEGRMSAEATGEKGRLLLQVHVGEAGGNWEIAGVWWRYLDR